MVHYHPLRGLGHVPSYGEWAGAYFGASRLSRWTGLARSSPSTPEGPCPHSRSSILTRRSFALRPGGFSVACSHIRREPDGSLSAGAGYPPRRPVCDARSPYQARCTAGRGCGIGCRADGVGERQRWIEDAKPQTLGADPFERSGPPGGHRRLTG